ncbi:MAG TPA: aminotransferase class V-fold PLP-dependent enzyme [Solirubrobacteraceae bacterium]|nr:aminotransferase class V-fold PLP-dependent enzyme [Solirubrobacteraceae bacterium]
MDLDNDPLGLSAEQMRDLGYRTVDMLVEQLSDRSVPAVRRSAPGELRARLGGGPPPTARPWDELMGQMKDDVLGFISRLDHPAYFAFIPACSTFPGALGDLITAAMSIDASLWMSAAGPSQLELTVLDWFKEWIGYPAEAAGVLVSGGSAANLTALACAREALLGPMTDRVVAYASDQSHSSVARASRVMGFRPDQVRVLPTDAHHRIRLDALVGAIEADLEAGLQPLVVAANAGATNTGAVDPLPELAEICHQRGMWLHVDGAYGGFAALTERGRRRLAGIELADSVTLDPHKWLYQPIECGCVLIRDGRLLSQAFTIDPDYLADRLSEEVNFSDRGLQLTRASHALKIWLSMSYFGTGAFAAAIDRSLDLALLAEGHVRETPALELLSPATLGIVCFRRSFEGVEEEDEIAVLNAELVGAFEQTGRGLVSSTRLHGKYAIRMCVMNHTTRPDDVRATLDWFAHAATPSREVPQPVSRYEDRRGDMESGWGQANSFDTATLRAIPLFASLDARELEVVQRSARELEIEAGEVVIHRWEGTRNFYVILAGGVAIELDEHRVELGPGQFFGELAALDWGAGFGYVRTATVVARTDVRLLVLAPAILDELVRSAPEVDRQIRAAVRERLPSV